MSTIEKNKRFNQTKTMNMVLSAVFTALMIVGSFLRVTIPGVPIVITFQLFFAVLSGAILGKKWGSASILLYIALGLLGIPVFATGGGITYVLTPTFGYLLGFVAAAFIVGMICETCEKRNGDFRIWQFIIAACIGVITANVFGVLHTYLLPIYQGVDSRRTFTSIITVSFGMLMIKDMILCILASPLVIRLYKIKDKVKY